MAHRRETCIQWPADHHIKEYICDKIFHCNNLLRMYAVPVREIISLFQR